MSENALAVLGNLNLSTQMASDEVYEGLAKANEFLGRLQLYTKGTAINKKLIGPGEYGIPEGDDEITKLGESVDLIPLARRPKALDMSDKEAIIVNFDVTSDTFHDIQARAGEQNSGCMYGISFLVIERTTGRFLEFFCGTKSTRQEAGKIGGFLNLTAEQIKIMEDKGQDVSKLKPHGPLPMTLKSKLVEKGSFSWHVPVVLPCSTPFTRLPSVEAMNDQIAKFTTIKDGGVEKATEPAAKNRRAR